jgi:tryptophan 6-halogenase
MPGQTADRPIREIVILGGGTAGWLTASYLQKALPKDLRITLVESERIGRIGVGEATVPTLRATLDFLGLKEQDWMPACGAGFKNAIRFVNWKDGPEQPGHFYHPFHHQRGQLVELYGKTYFMDLDGRIPIGQYWLRNRLRGTEARDFAYACSPNTALCDLNKAPRELGAGSSALNYAYHFDANRFADFLKARAVQAGVEHVQGEFESAGAQAGCISFLRLKDGRVLEGDFFVDCTGFQSLLLGGVLGERFVTQEKHLLCDSAVALHVPYLDPDGEFQPYTTSTARNAGWQWNIPLQDRIGAGYVYSSAFASQNEAAEEALGFYDGPGRKISEARHIPMRVGYHPNFWSGNCVGIGLAGSFIEPLESTSIFMTEFQLFQLIRHFPGGRREPALARRYNRKIEECYLEVRDFVLMHYSLSRRRDTPFWREATRPERVTDTLEEKLSLFRERLPLESDFPFHLFSAFNYSCILAGMEFLPDRPLPLLSHLESDASGSYFEQIRSQTEALAARLPGLREFCEGLRGNA